MKRLLLCAAIAVGTNCLGQGTGSILTKDTLAERSLNETVISASRISEKILRSPVAIDRLKAADAANTGALTCFDAVGNMKSVQAITPSLGFRVVNTRGFANTTNVRFTQLIDGVDNQAPHIGAPIANALGANDLDIDVVEIIPGTAAALYGMNAINGLANIRTKNPFEYQGLTVQQLTGVNHVGSADEFGPQLYTQSSLRFAKAYGSHFALKVNGSYTQGRDWVANNRSDLAPTLNVSTGLTGASNPAYDEVNSYGDESSNRRTLTLDGKKYVVSRTGYREVDIDDQRIQNYKGDIGIYYRPSAGHELSATYKGALINNLYQRSNRFRLQDYSLGQYALDYRSSAVEANAYLTQENTGKSYNIRSLAENMDKAFKSDDAWFADYAKAYNASVKDGNVTADALAAARTAADKGRYEPGTDAYNQKKEELININNWDYGAALRVKSYMFHSEGMVKWAQVFPKVFASRGIELLSGFDRRTYIIIPDGNYFINPVDTGKNLLYSKTGGFVQLSKSLFDKSLNLSGTVRADKSDYFDWKFNPRVTAVFALNEGAVVRAAYQSGYRFPSIFEGFSNVNIGGVKRVGGLSIMSNGIFENSYTKASIDAFQAKVTNDINTLGLTQAQAIDKNKGMLNKNPYTYLQPEYVRSLEMGFRGLAINRRLFVDVDAYYNAYRNFIAQMEGSIPKTSNPDSVATYLYSKTKQDKYRLWTNSLSKIYNYGASLGVRYKYNENISFYGNATYSKLDRTENKDGLEDGYNTPEWIINGTVTAAHIWRNLGAGIACRYQSKYNYVSFLVSGEVPSFWTADIQVNYNFFKPGLTVKVTATNLMNKPYYDMLGGSSIGGVYYVSIIYEVLKHK